MSVALVVVLTISFSLNAVFLYIIMSKKRQLQIFLGRLNDEYLRPLDFALARSLTSALSAIKLITQSRLHFEESNQINEREAASALQVCSALTTNVQKRLVGIVDAMNLSGSQNLSSWKSDLDLAENAIEGIFQAIENVPVEASSRISSLLVQIRPLLSSRTPQQEIWSNIHSTQRALDACHEFLQMQIGVYFSSPTRRFSIQDLHEALLDRTKERKIDRFVSFDVSPVSESFEGSFETLHNCIYKIITKALAENSSAKPSVKITVIERKDAFVLKVAIQVDESLAWHKRGLRSSFSIPALAPNHDEAVADSTIFSSLDLVELHNVSRILQFLGGGVTFDESDPRGVMEIELPLLVSKTAVSILLIDDDDNLGIILKNGLKRENVSIVQAFDLSQATELYLEYAFDVVITDVNIGEQNGIDFARRFGNLPRKSAKVPPVIACSGETRIPDQGFLKENGVSDYVLKDRNLAKNLLASLNRLGVLKK